MIKNNIYRIRFFVSTIITVNLILWRIAFPVCCHAASANSDAGIKQPLTYSAKHGTEFILKRNHSAIEIRNQAGDLLISQPWDLTSKVIITGADGENDTLTVDLSGGNPIPAEGVFYAGGAEGFDTLAVRGGQSQQVAHTALNASDGIVTIGGHPVHYNGLEPVTIGIATSLTINGLAGADTITVSDDATADDNYSLIDGPTMESVFFASPTGSLTINGMDGNDTFNYNGLDSQFGTAVTVTLDGGVPAFGDAGVPPGDTLNYGLAGIYVLTGPGNGYIVQSGLPTVYFQNFETIIGASLEQAEDFGDAPDPAYPTLLASNGARHILDTTSGAIYLGACVDAEADGQPAATASGDDTNIGLTALGACATGGDDDEGVVFTGILVAGTTGNINVTVSAACTLSAWMDFNADGDWDDAGEDLFPAGQALAAGVNNLNFTIPATTVTATTYARFRATTDGAVAYTGQATNGEVEDYTVDILADTDGDGEPDITDGCPLDPAKIAPGACGCGVADTDTDTDGTPDCNDGCPLDPAKIAPGACGCGVADTDTDTDGTLDCNDGCPLDPAKIAPGTCGCGVADTDTDTDGTPDCNDGCPTDINKIAPGTCGCGVADTDTDTDGTPDCNDGCPLNPAKLVPGLCGCNMPDTDSDGDGTPNCHDFCPDDPDKTDPGACGCGQEDKDTDNDGMADCRDECPDDLSKVEPGVCGCGVADTDTDMDGTPDCIDQCPEDSSRTEPGPCGCMTVNRDMEDLPADLDLDGDGLPDREQENLWVVPSDKDGVYFGVTVSTAIRLEHLEWMDASAVSDMNNRPDVFPLGLVSFCLLTGSLGDTVEVTIYCSQSIPENELWYKYDEDNGWYDYSEYVRTSSDRMSVTVQVQDGGFGDADGMIDGAVRGPIGPAMFNADDADDSGDGGDTGDSRDSSGHGGCFLKALSR